VSSKLFKKVLVALDFSGPSMELFNSLADLRHLGLEELLLVHAVRAELGVQDGIHPLQQKFLGKIRGKKEELAQEELRVNVEVPVGAPAEEIKRLAIEKKMDLILIGSVGESSTARELLLGSTVADVVRIAPVPVLVEKYLPAVSAELNKKLGELADRLGTFVKDVVNPNIPSIAREYSQLSGELLYYAEQIKKNPLSDNATIKRIPIFKDNLASVILPTDFSPSAGYVFNQMLGLAGLLKEVILLNVVDRGKTVEEIKNAETEAGEYLKQWENKFLEKGVKARSIVLIGTPSSSHIISTAEKEGASLIALSRRGRGKIANLFIGSTADQVVRRSSCPVLLFQKSVD
jgi:nucleotide-binding universal stress UspA family protein